MKENEHVVPREEGWGVKVAGGERASKIFPTRIEAINYAKELAQKHKVCMVIHDEEGKFEEFDCDPEMKNKHVVKKTQGWGVITEGGHEVERIFENKGSAMAYAYDMATKNNTCMLVHDKEGKFQSVTCPPDGHPGIIEIMRMKLKM